MTFTYLFSYFFLFFHSFIYFWLKGRGNTQIAKKMVVTKGVPNVKMLTIMHFVPIAYCFLLPHARVSHKPIYRGLNVILKTTIATYDFLGRWRVMVLTPL